MHSKQLYPEEFKIEAVKQITERGHRVADVSTRIGASQHSLYKPIKAYSAPAAERHAQVSQAEELRRPKPRCGARRRSELRQRLSRSGQTFSMKSTFVLYEQIKRSPASSIGIYPGQGGGGWAPTHA